MAKHFSSGKFANSYKFFKPAFGWPEGFLDSDTVFDVTKSSLALSSKLGKRASFVNTLIIRGIGYRAFAVSNDFVGKGGIQNFIETRRPIYANHDAPEPNVVSNVAKFELGDSRYLIVRAGHTRDLSLPLPPEVSCRTLKKDRKLIVFSKSKEIASSSAKFV